MFLDVPQGHFKISDVGKACAHLADQYEAHPELWIKGHYWQGADGQSCNVESSAETRAPTCCCMIGGIRYLTAGFGYDHFVHLIQDFIGRNTTNNNLIAWNDEQTGVDTVITELRLIAGYLS